MKLARRRMALSDAKCLNVFANRLMSGPCGNAEVLLVTLLRRRMALRDAKCLNVFANSAKTYGPQ